MSESSGNGSGDGHGNGGGNSGSGGGNGGHGGNDDQIEIVVDGNIKTVKGEKWVVHSLKTVLEIDQSKVLAEITANGLHDLEDTQIIELHRGEKFMTHGRTGGSS